MSYCQACKFRCECARMVHTGEAKVLVSLTAADLEYLLGEGTTMDVGPLLRKLEQARALLEGTLRYEQRTDP